MYISVPYVGFVFGSVLQKIEDIPRSLYTLASKESSIHFWDGVSFSTELHISLRRSTVALGFQTDLPSALKHHIQALNIDPALEDSWLEPTALWEVPLEQTWVCPSGLVPGRVSSSKPEGWLKPTSLWARSARADCVRCTNPMSFVLFLPPFPAPL